MAASLGRRKPIGVILADQAATGSGEHELKRALGVWGVTALGIGAIVGTGIFVLTGKAAATSAGPAIVVSFVVAGGVGVLGGFCCVGVGWRVSFSGREWI